MKLPFFQKCPFIYLIIIGCIAIPISQASAETSIEQKIVRVGTLADYSPFCFMKESGQQVTSELIPPGEDSQKLQGSSWDTLRESLHEMGYTIDLKIYPWIRAVHEVKGGAVDVIFPAGHTEERKAFFHYSKNAVNQVDFLVYVGQEYSTPWNGLKSLDGVKLGAIRGWNYGPKIAEQDLQIQLVSTIESGFKMLEAKRFEGFIGYETTFDYALKLAGMADKYKKLPIFDFSKEYLVGAKNSAKVKKIIADFDIGRERIDKNGTMEKIRAKWR